MTMKMNVKKIFNYHYKGKKQNICIAAVMTLNDLIEKKEFQTIKEYSDLLKGSIDEFGTQGISYIAIMSATELYTRYITYIKTDLTSDLLKYKSVLLKRSKEFIDKMLKSYDDVANNCKKQLEDRENVLIYNGTKLVFYALKKHLEIYPRKSMTIYVISTKDGADELEFIKHKFKDVLVRELSEKHAAFAVQRSEVVLTAADVVVGSGGFVGDAGVVSIAVLAHQYKVDLCVLSEVFRFMSVYPLPSGDVVTQLKVFSRDTEAPIKLPHHKTEPELPPAVELVDPEYVSFIVSDLGCLFPQSVSEELIKLYL